MMQRFASFHLLARANSADFEPQSQNITDLEIWDVNKIWGSRISMFKGPVAQSV
jgi:hypothetical protein